MSTTYPCPMNGRQLDHVVVATPDLDSSAAAFTTLGMFVTARSDHPFGTSNRLVVAQNGYLELVTVTDPSRVPPDGFARFVADGLAAGRTGPVMVVMKSADPQDDHRRLTELGMTSTGPVEFGRWVDLPDGNRTRAEFVSVFPDLGSDEVSAFYCRHLTPEVVWHRSHMTHPIGALRIAKVTVRHPGSGPWQRLAAMADVAATTTLRLGSVELTTGPPSLRLSADVAETRTADLGGTRVEVVAESAR